QTMIQTMLTTVFAVALSLSAPIDPLILPASTPTAQTEPVAKPVAKPVAMPAAPRTPAPTATELAPLAFMAGHWVTELPNGMVSEELWMPARGKSMLGSFRQTRPDGTPAFFEFTQLVVGANGEVLLRQVHVHGNFETDPRRKDPMTLRLSSAKNNVAVFVPVDDAAKANAGDLASVTYSLNDADTLAMRIESKPVKQGEGDGALTKAVTKPVVIDMTLKRAK
ncbi:MAG: hypothetical protein RLY72_1545, partial [Planctomycetota bacterium]